MKFKYRKVPANTSKAFPQRNFFLRPIIPISISFKDKSIRYEALVDSGADYNIFPAELGRILGIIIEKGDLNPVMGVSGNGIPVYFHKLDIEVGGWRYNVDIGFADNINQNQGILGQKGFFDLFKISFEYMKEDLEILPKSGN